MLRWGLGPRPPRSSRCRPIVSVAGLPSVVAAAPRLGWRSTTNVDEAPEQQSLW